MSTRRERQALREIIQSIDAIDVYMRSLPTLPDMGIDAIKYQLVIIGEAVARVSEQTRDRAPEIPWDRIKSQRNVLVHAYDEVDLPRILTILDRHLDPLRSAVETLLAEIVPLSDPLPSVVGQEGERDEGSHTATATRAPRSMSGDGEGPIPGPPGGGPGAA